MAEQIPFKETVHEIETPRLGAEWLKGTSEWGSGPEEALGGSGGRPGLAGPPPSQALLPVLPLELGERSGRSFSRFQITFITHRADKSKRKWGKREVVRREGIAASSFRKGENPKYTKPGSFLVLKHCWRTINPKRVVPAANSSQGTTNLSDTHLEGETQGFYFFIFFNVSKCYRVFFEKTFLHECRVLLILFCLILLWLLLIAELRP